MSSNIDKTFLILKYGDYHNNLRLIPDCGEDILRKIYSEIREVKYTYKEFVWLLRYSVYLISEYKREILDATDKVLRNEK